MEEDFTELFCILNAIFKIMSPYCPSWHKWTSIMQTNMNHEPFLAPQQCALWVLVSLTAASSCSPAKLIIISIRASFLCCASCYLKHSFLKSDVKVTSISPEWRKWKWSVSRSKDFSSVWSAQAEGEWHENQGDGFLEQWLSEVVRSTLQKCPFSS